MLYYLLYPLHEYFGAFYVFKYSTFRAIYAALTAILICFLIGNKVIKKLKELNVHQPIRDDGPSTHKLKSGTPTMGGIMIVFAVILSTLLWAKIENRFIILTMFVFLWFALLGFIDDYLKLIQKTSKGIPIRYKLLCQIVGVLIVCIYLAYNPVSLDYETHIKIPLVKFPLDLGLFYFVFIGIVIVGSSNAVNLTDGLDGLAIGSLIFTTLSLTVVTYLVGHSKFSEYLRIIHIPESGELVIFCTSMVGASIGFLWFNCHPASVFMGDVGSLSLGAVLGLVAVLIKQELLLILIGGIFVVEAVSVLLQIISFRFFGKRIFKMAPLHHHFELNGIPETKIVVRFWIIVIIISLASLSLLKLR
ncbi:MAG: phospho-N-acetylmuramoyl-pentapeptide-transferase [Candidatus Firestonebacteria bacterium]